MLKKAFSSFFLYMCLMGACYSYHVSDGTLITHPNVESDYVDSRNVHVWLPEQYEELKQKGEKLAVVYMHDGQMLFDSNKTWNKQEWGVDEVANQLITDGKTKPFIVVGVDNGGKSLRHSEYFPQKPFEALPKSYQQELYKAKRDEHTPLFGEKVKSDGYLKFLVKELKPFIDKTYAVKTDKDNTFVMGSSMGGLISMYAISEYPDVFGAAACISTHWPGIFSLDNNPIPAAFFDYLSTSLADGKDHRIYFDYGTETLDSLYPGLQKQADEVIKTRGYNTGNWVTRKFVGAAHTEIDWNKRLHIPLTFLLAK